MQLIDNLHAFIWQSMTTNNCNTYLIDGPTRVLIDPGHVHTFDHVRQGLEQLGLGIEDIGLIICTHAHPDHMEAVQLFKQTSAQVTIHEKAWQLVEDMESQIAAMGIDLASFSPNFFLKEGNLAVNGLEFQVFHTPGHSPGSVSLYWPEQKVLFSGDLIFQDGIGRTDLPGGNGSLLKESIKRVATLDTEWILPGHGNVISGASEVKSNFARIEQFWFAYI